MALDLAFYLRRTAQELTLAEQGGPGADIHRQLAGCYQKKVEALDRALETGRPNLHPVETQPRERVAFLAHGGITGSAA